MGGDIIYKSSNVLSQSFGGEDAVHQTHEDGWSVLEAHGHPTILVEAQRRDEGSLFRGSLGERDLPKATLEIDGPEELGSMQGVEERRNIR